VVCLDGAGCEAAKRELAEILGARPEIVEVDFAGAGVGDGARLLPGRLAISALIYRASTFRVSPGMS